jgi:hypothetical protein
LKSYPESFKLINQEMAEKSKIFLENPKKPIEGFNLVPRFFIRTLFKLNKASKRKKNGLLVLFDVVNKNLDSGRPAADRRNIFLAENHFFVYKKS